MAHLNSKRATPGFGDYALVYVDPVAIPTRTPNSQCHTFAFALKGEYEMHQFGEATKVGAMGLTYWDSLAIQSGL